MRRPGSFGKAPHIPKEGICGPPVCPRHSWPISSTLQVNANKNQARVSFILRSGKYVGGDPLDCALCESLR